MKLKGGISNSHVKREVLSLSYHRVVAKRLESGAEAAASHGPVASLQGASQCVRWHGEGGPSQEFEVFRVGDARAPRVRVGAQIRR
jgi:hypothetical protein